MAVPDFQSLMLPLFRRLGDTQEWHYAPMVEAVAKDFQLCEADLTERLPSGRETVFYNRLGCAKIHLLKAGLLQLPAKRAMRITELSLSALQTQPTRIDLTFLNQYEAHREFRGMRSATDSPGGKSPPQADADQETRTPHEKLESAHQALRRELADDLLAKVKGTTPEFFEQLVVKLLVAMGYGGNYADAARAVGRSGDGGIDGVLKEDRLGFDVIYLQAKKWQYVRRTAGDSEVCGRVAGPKGAQRRLSNHCHLL